MLEATKPITPQPVAEWRKQGTTRSRLTIQDMSEIIGCSYRTMWTYINRGAHIRWNRKHQRYELVEQVDWVVLWPKGRDS